MKSALIVSVAAGVAGLIFILGVTAVLLMPPPPAPPASKPNVEYVIFAGEIDGQFAFGQSPRQLAVPGPQLNVKVGDTVRIVLVVSGKEHHSLIVSQENKEVSHIEPVFQGASIGTAEKPLVPGVRGYVEFKAEKPGTYYYVCPVPGHVSKGQWGVIVVSGQS